MFISIYEILFNRVYNFITLIRFRVVFYCVILITSKKREMGRERKCDRVRRDGMHGEKEREREGGGREKTM